MAGKILGRLNKPEIEGYKYRSPDQTNAKDYTPNLRENVGKSVEADAERIKKELILQQTQVNVQKMQLDELLLE